MVDDDDWTACPECDKKVKTKNLTRHFQRVHEMTADEARSKQEAYHKDRGSKSGRGKGKWKMAAAVIIAIVVISAAAFIALRPAGDEGDENGDDNGLPDDPFRVEFTTDDGFKIVGSYYKAKAGVINTSTIDRPTLILVHGMNEKREVWNNYGLVDDGLNWGFNVLTFDIRMHGESVYKNGKRVEVNSGDLGNMDLDVRSALEFVNAKYATNGQFAVIGASVGANAVLEAAVYERSIESIVLLSPSLNFASQNIPSYDPIYFTGPNPVFIACSELEGVKSDCETLADRAVDDPYLERNVRLKIYPGVSDHGTNLFKIDEFNSDLQNWLVSTMISNDP